MVDALREAWRVLTPAGVLIDVRPAPAPIVVEIVRSHQAVWTTTVESYSAPEDNAAADAVVGNAVSLEWLRLESHLRFNFDIYCDNADDLKIYIDGRKLCGAEIPYAEVEERRQEFGAGKQTARLRCRRLWMLSAFRSNSSRLACG